MFDKRLDIIRELVRRDEYDVTGHVLDYLEQDEFSLEDIVVSILTGEINKRERDELREAEDGFKYTICGRTACGRPFQTVGKIIRDEEGRLYLVITAV